MAEDAEHGSHNPLIVVVQLLSPHLILWESTIVDLEMQAKASPWKTIQEFRLIKENVE